MATRERTYLPPDDDAAFRALVAGLDREQAPELVMPDGTRVRLPEEVANVLYEVATAMSRGQAVTVAPQHTTLTTQQAADLLGVSRPTLVRLLEDGQLPHTRPGRHRRIRLSDLLTYRERVRHGRDEALDELVEVSEEAGLYGDDVTEARLRR